MRKSVYCAFAAVVVLSAAGATLGDDTCNGLPAIFCDSFDRYCTSPPAWPDTCTTSSSRSDGALRNVWNWTSYNWNTNSLDGSNMVVEDNTLILASPPYGGRAANGGDEGGHLGQNTVDLTSYIGAALPGKTVANGSDAEPLIISFNFSAGTVDAFGFSSGYMELNLGDDTNGSVNNTTQAPTDYVLVGANESETCYSCYGYCQSLGVDNSGPHVPWPSICQSYNSRTASPACPPLQTSIRTSLAIGALSMLDEDPCHCATTANQKPSNYHLSYYDGNKWRILKSNVFPGNGGDFVLGNKIDTVALTIKTSTVDIYHRARVAGTWIESTATGVPRLYTGGFNRLRAGAKEGCVLQNGTYACDPAHFNGKKRPIRNGETRCDGGGWQTNGSKFVSFDNVWLRGGEGNVLSGACCKNDGSCVETDQTACAAMSGHFQGMDTTCAETACCPFPYADADHDGDVDQDDFGAFQICYNGSGAVPTGCDCFNRDADADVDGLDYTAFTACFTGANVPWTQAATPSCAP